MRVVFVVEYDVPESQDDVQRKINEVGDALRLPTDDDERRSATVCIQDTADRVLAAASALVYDPVAFAVPDDEEAE